MKENFFLLCCTILELPHKVQKMKWQERAQWKGITLLLPPSSNLFLNFQKYKDQVPRWIPEFRFKFLSWTFLCYRSNLNFGGERTWIQRLVSSCFWTKVLSLDVLSFDADFYFRPFSSLICFQIGLVSFQGWEEIGQPWKNRRVFSLYLISLHSLSTHKYLATHVLDIFSSSHA